MKKIIALLCAVIVTACAVIGVTNVRSSNKIKNLNADLTALRETAEASSQDAAAKAAQIETLTTDVAEKAAQIEGLQADVSAQAAQLEALTAQAAEKAAQLETLQAELDARAAEAETLRADIEAKAAQIETLTAQAGAQAVGDGHGRRSTQPLIGVSEPMPWGVLIEVQVPAGTFFQASPW